jgi:hypothetical protein
MKLTASFSVAAALLAIAVAFAQTPNTSGSTRNADIMESNVPANNTPSKATDENHATAQSISDACHQQASAKQLTRARVIKGVKAAELRPLPRKILAIFAAARFSAIARVPAAPGARAAPQFHRGDAQVVAGSATT